MSFEVEIMSTDKYPGIFSHQMNQVSLYIIQMFFAIIHLTESLEERKQYYNPVIHQRFEGSNIQLKILPLKGRMTNQTKLFHRGYYTVARRYEFYVRVARTISHE